MADEDLDAQDEDLDEDELEEQPESPLLIARKRDLSKRAGIREELLELYDEIETGFRNQWSRANDNLDYWDIYDCKLNARQFYYGNSKIFVPIVRNAVDARKTRFTNQIFPQSGRYVETTSVDGTEPDATTALLEHYVRAAQLRTKVMPALMRNGDIEGQYSLYVSWETAERNVVWRTKAEAETEGMTNPLLPPEDDMAEEMIEGAHPVVEVLPDSDVLVLPQTADTLVEALQAGGSVTVLRRWYKGNIRQMMRDGWIRKDAGKVLLKQLTAVTKPGEVNTKKKHVDAAGIQEGENGTRFAQVYETFTLLPVAGKNLICRVFFGGDELILGCHRNPLWSDRLPVISAPVEKVAGSFKGQSKIKPCADMQYAANDAVNEAWDSAAFSMMPIVMTDPEKNPRTGSMVLSLAAVWETSPNDTKVLEFPKLWQDGFQMVSACKAEVSQTLSVSPAAITAGGAGRLGGEKPTQAEVAQEQQIDILTTADAVTVVEEGILNPMLQLFLELDHQYRDKGITVRKYGEMGLRANLEEIPPIQMENRYLFSWFGVEQARNAQQVQNQIATMNVVRGIPPDQLGDHKLNLVPIIQNLVENAFGPRLAPLIFTKLEDLLPVPPQIENQLLADGFEVPTHQADEDQAHIMEHQVAMQQLMTSGQGAGAVRKFQAHIFRHVQQMQMKAMQMQQAMLAGAVGGPAPEGAPGVPGGAVGAQKQPGVAGTPRPGAQPGQPRAQRPAGAIHQDRMVDPQVMPRKATQGV